MQRISVSGLAEGMKVARNVYDENGRVLIGVGVVLKQNYIERLKNFGICSVFIDFAGLPQLEIPEVVKEETRIKAVNRMKQSFQNFRTTQKFNYKQFKEIATSIVEEIMHRRDTLFHLTDIRTYDDYTFSHSVNVCILSVLTGISRHYTIYRLKELALGALLHDIGKVMLPVEVLRKPGILTTEEYDIIKTHAEQGFEILRRQQDQVPLLACHVAFQHQERVDGTGYPRQIKGDQIHEYARIAAIADVYDALTSDRPYRKGMLPHEAYEIMMSLSGSHLDAEFLGTFFKKIAIYPLGSVVYLNTGEVGMVIDTDSDLPMRPKIQLITDKSGAFRHDRITVDLTMQLTVFIDKVLKDEEAQQWISVPS